VLVGGGIVLLGFDFLREERRSVAGVKIDPVASGDDVAVFGTEGAPRFLGERRGVDTR
jgi:hypothetical protein